MSNGDDHDYLMGFLVRTEWHDWHKAHSRCSVPISHQAHCLYHLYSTISSYKQTAQLLKKKVSATEPCVLRKRCKTFFPIMKMWRPINPIKKQKAFWVVGNPPIACDVILPRKSRNKRRNTFDICSLSLKSSLLVSRGVWKKPQILSWIVFIVFVNTVEMFCF